MDRMDRLDRMDRMDRMDRYSQSSRNTDMHNDRSGMMDSNRGMNIMNNHRDRNSPQYHNNHNNNINMHSNHSNHANHSINHQNNHLNSHPNSHVNHHTPSPSYCPDNGIKSDSPSRKRRRVSRVPSQSPPSMWEQRQSPRNQQQVIQIVIQTFLMLKIYLR